MNNYELAEDALKHIIALAFLAGKRVAIKSIGDVTEEQWSKASNIYASKLIESLGKSSPTEGTKDDQHDKA